MIKIMSKKEYNTLKSMVDEAVTNVVDYKKRVRDVEDTYQKNSGITIRNDVTKVFAKFDKIEMCIIQAGIMKLIEKPGNNTEDLQFYLDLAKKVGGFIEHMQDPKEEDLK